MKRFVIATASALFLLAGSAAASVPFGPASGSAAGNPSSQSAVRGPGVAPAATGAPVGLAPFAPGGGAGILADPDFALPGLAGGAGRLHVALADVDVLDQSGALLRHHLADHAAFASLSTGEDDHVVTFFDTCKGHRTSGAREMIFM